MHQNKQRNKNSIETFIKQQKRSSKWLRHSSKPIKIYKNLNIPCIPVYLNSGNFWPRNSFMKYASNIKIIFKEPILEGLENDDFLKQLSNKIHY